MSKKLILIITSFFCMFGLVFSNFHTEARAATTLAAPTASGIVTSGFTMKWNAVKNANHYQVKYSTNKDFKKSKTVDKYNSRWLGDLTQNTTYYVKYRAVYKNKTKITYSGWSKVLKVKTNPRFPTKFATSYKKKINGITVSWGKSEFAQKYRVMIADNKGMDINVKNYYTKKRSLDIAMNSKDGQPKYVRVFAYNADYMRYSNERMLVKPSSPAVSNGEKITIASQNLLCSDCTYDGGKATPKLKDRAPLLLKDVRTYNPDIYLIQEGANSKNGEPEGQLTKFYNTLQDYGYSFNKAIEKDGATGDKNRIAFKKDKYSLVKSGRFSLPQEGRSAVWVLLKSKTTGKQFYVTSTHISPTISAQQKMKDAKTVSDTMDSINTKNYPIFLGGDMNSTPNDHDGNAKTIYLKQGWNDAASATKTVNAQYGTYNTLGNGIMTDSYGRIDYLYSKNTGGWSYYKNVITVDSQGKITSKHGSDHDMIIGHTTIG